MPEAALERFRSHLSAPRRQELDALAEGPSRLQTLMDPINAEFHFAWIPQEAFLEQLARACEEAPVPLRDWFDRMRGVDFYLAVACVRMHRDALAAFERRFGHEIEAVAQRFARVADPLDLAQVVRMKLFLGTETSGPKIASYSGQGFLLNWLRVLAVRTCVDATRAKSIRTTVLADDLLASLSDPAHNLELNVLKQRGIALFKSAFSDAVAALDPLDRNVLRQHLVEQLSIDQISAVSGVHRATAARRIVRAKDALLESTKQRFAVKMGVDIGEIDGVLLDLRSRLEASVERLLTGN